MERECEVNPARNLLPIGGRVMVVVAPVVARIRLRLHRVLLRRVPAVEVAAADNGVGGTVVNDGVSIEMSSIPNDEGTILS
jgi:hypothetical protein